MTLLFPKPVKRKKRRKQIPRRSKFKAHGANPLKHYQRKLTDYQVTIRAEACRQDRLRKRTKAELRFEELLNENGIKYEKEKIVQNGDRWVLADFVVQTAFGRIVDCHGRRPLHVGTPIWVEIDGSAHNNQQRYDIGRENWLKEKGYKVIRFTNAQVLKNPEEVKEKLREIINANN